MEWTFSRLVFIIEGNANHDGKIVGAGASKMARTRCNAKIKGRPC
jgi:hypothetical protein